MSDETKLFILISMLAVMLAVIMLMSVIGIIRDENYSELDKVKKCDKYIESLDCNNLLYCRKLCRRYGYVDCYRDAEFIYPIKCKK